MLKATQNHQFSDVYCWY